MDSWIDRHVEVLHSSPYVSDCESCDRRDATEVSMCGKIVCVDCKKLHTPESCPDCRKEDLFMEDARESDPF